MSYIYIYEGIGSSFNLNRYSFSGEIRKKIEAYSRRVKESTEIDMWRYMTSLKREENSLYNWLSGYICNYALSETYIEKGFKPKLLVGYSMGLITSLAVHGAITFEEGISLVRLAFNYGSSKEQQKTSMAVILGLDKQCVQGIIQGAGMQERVYIASENSLYSILISGEAEALNTVINQCYEEGAIRIQTIDTPKAFHSKFARSGVEDFIEGLEQIHIKELKTPLISCYDYKLVTEADEIRKELIRNLYEAMKWKQVLDKLVEEGYRQFLEISIKGKFINMYMNEQDENIEYMNIKQLMED